MTVATIYPDVDTQIQNTAGSSWQTVNGLVDPILDSYAGAYAIQNLPAMHFDLSAIPSGATITDATLTLTTGTTQSQGLGLTVQVGLVTTAAISETDAATSARQDISTNRASNSLTMNSSTTFTWTGLASLVSSWKSGAITNYGLVLYASSYSAGDFGDAYFSREDGTTANRPHLTVTYTTDTSAPTSTVQGAGWDTGPTAGQALYTAVDEASRDDSDYVFTDVTKLPGEVIFGMGTLGAPATGFLRVIKVAYEAPVASAPLTVTITLYQTTTQIAQWVINGVTPGSFIESDNTLTSGQQAAISDWTALRVGVKVAFT